MLTDDDEDGRFLLYRSGGYRSPKPGSSPAPSFLRFEIAANKSLRSAKYSSWTPQRTWVIDKRTLISLSAVH